MTTKADRLHSEAQTDAAIRADQAKAGDLQWPNHYLMSMADATHLQACRTNELLERLVEKLGPGESELNDTVADSPFEPPGHGGWLRRV